MYVQNYCNKDTKISRKKYSNFIHNLRLRKTLGQNCYPDNYANREVTHLLTAVAIRK